MNKVQYFFILLAQFISIYQSYDSQCSIKYCLQCDSYGKCILCEENYYYSKQRDTCVSNCSQQFYVRETQTCTQICGKNYKEDILTQTCESLLKCDLPQQHGQNLMGSQIIQKIDYLEDLDVLVGLFQQSQYLHVWNMQTKNLLLQVNLYIGQIVNYEIFEQNIADKIKSMSKDSRVFDEDPQNQLQKTNTFQKYLVAFSFQGDLVTVDLNTFQIVNQDKFDIGNFTLADYNSMLLVKSLQNTFLYSISNSGRQIQKQKIEGSKMSDYLNFQSKVLMINNDQQTGYSIILTEQSLYLIKDYFDNDHLFEIAPCQIYKNVNKINAFSFSFNTGESNKFSSIFAISLKQTPNQLQIYSEKICIQQIELQSDIISIFIIKTKNKIVVTTQNSIIILFKDNISLTYQIVKNFMISQDSSIIATLSQLEQVFQQFIIVNKSNNQMDLYLIDSVENQIQLFQANIFQSSNGYLKLYFYLDQKDIEDKTEKKIIYPKGIILLNSTIFYSNFDNISKQYVNQGNTINYQIKQVLPQSNITSIIYLDKRSIVITCLQNLSMYFWTLTNNGAELICYIKTPVPCQYMKVNSDESHLFATSNDINNISYYFFVVQLSNFDIEFQTIYKQAQLISFEIQYLSFVNLKQQKSEFIIFLETERIIIMYYDYIQSTLIVQSEYQIQDAFYQSYMKENTLLVCSQQKMQTIQLYYNQTVQIALNQSLSFQSQLVDCNYNSYYEKISASSQKSQVYLISQNLTQEYLFRLKLDQISQKCLFRSSNSVVCKLYSPKESMQYQIVLIQFKENTLFILYQYIQVLDILLVDNQPFSNYNDIFQIYFTKALPQASSLNSLRVKIDEKQNFSFSYYSSQYVYDKVCTTSYYLQKEFRQIYGCSNGFTGDIFFQPQNDYPKKKFISIKNSQSTVLLKNIFKLIVYGENSMEIFDYKNYKSLFLFQCQSDDKIIQLLEINYPFEYIMMLTSSSLNFIKQIGQSKIFFFKQQVNNINLIKDL